MASFSSSLGAPELIFLSPQNPTKRLKLSVYRPIDFHPKRSRKAVGVRIRSAKREDSAVLESGDRELATKLNKSVNGNGSYSSSNGSLKFVNGNGNGNVALRSEDEVVKVVKLKEVVNKKKSIEEIGQEDAWFKQKAQVEV